MKRRVRKIANFFAFNLLFFALYLNFIHKDKKSSALTGEPIQQTTAAFGGTVLVDNPDQYLQKKQAVIAHPVAAPKTDEPTTAALKLSIN